MSDNPEAVAARVCPDCGVFAGGVWLHRPDCPRRATTEATDTEGLRAALARLVVNGNDIDAALYHDDAIYHGIVHRIHNAALATTPSVQSNDADWQETAHRNAEEAFAQARLTNEAQQQVAALREALNETQRTLEYLWSATGDRAPDIPVSDLFNDDDPLIQDIPTVLGKARMALHGAAALAAEDKP